MTEDAIGWILMEVNAQQKKQIMEGILIRFNMGVHGITSDNENYYFFELFM